MKLFFTFTMVFTVIILNAQTNPEKTKISKDSINSANPKTEKFTFSIIPAANNTWCYDIYMDKKMFIHQPSIPAVPGNEGFKTKDDAEKVAKFVIDKIKKGEMPPSVTIEEMKKLKVL